MADKFTLKLNNPITKKEWDLITDVDLDNTPRVIFHTKHGKDVEYVKVKHGHNIADGYIDHTRENKHARLFLCSECGYGIDDIYLANERDYPIDPNYCPNCGAPID